MLNTKLDEEGRFNLELEYRQFEVLIFWF